MQHDPIWLFYSELLLRDRWMMTPADVRPKALWTSATHRAVASASASLTVTGDYWSTSWHFHLGQSPSEQCQTLRSSPIQPHRPQCLFSVLLIHEHPSPPPPEVTLLPSRCGPHIINTPQCQDSLYISPSLPFSLISESSLPPFISILSMMIPLPCCHGNNRALIAWLLGNWHHL